MGKLKKNKIRAAIMVAFVISAGSVEAADAEAFRLSMPLGCKYGDNCFIQNYVDKGKDTEYQDFKCNKLSYDKHKGTDFRLLNIKQMKDGVKVLAATGGIVMGVRDGVDDVSIKESGTEKIKGIECGNGIRISNADGFFTQYCHMKKGSIRVKARDVVKTGDVLGEVGLSGGTEFPHLHLQVEHDKQIIDPFTGLSMESGCDSQKEPLWDEETAGLLRYIPTGILGAGFSDKPPSQKEMESGTLESKISADSPAVIFWVQLFGMMPDYKLTVILTAPDGKEIAAHSQTVEKHKATFSQFVGKKFRDPVAKGIYLGKVQIMLKERTVLEQNFQTIVR